MVSRLWYGIPNGNPLVVGGAGLMTAALMLPIIVMRYTIFKRLAQKVAAVEFLKPKWRGDRLDWLR